MGQQGRLSAGPVRLSGVNEQAAVLECDECACVSDTAPGWVGYLAPNPDRYELTGVVVVCPACAELEFGHEARSHYT